VLLSLDTGDDAGDLALRANHKRGSLDSHILPAIHALFLEHAKLLNHGLAGIGQKRKWQLVSIFEFLLGRGLVSGNTQHLRAGAVDFLVCVAEPARLIGSAGCIGLGIEKQDQGFSAIIFQ
jgi:hypothetical protein